MATRALWGLFKWGELLWGQGPSSADVSALHAQRDNVRIAYLFVIEGVSTMWVEGDSTDVALLAGTGGGSWIGTAYGSRTVKRGLTLPDPIFTQSIDPVDGMLQDHDVVVTLQDDESGYLATLFKAQWDGSDKERMGTRMAPDEDPAAATHNLWGGVGTVTTTNCHIGNEYIDSNGNRRELYIAPVADPAQTSTAQPAGLDHPVIQGDGRLPEVVVSSSPIQFAGRRCAIYRLVYDPVTASWPSWQAQYDGGSMIWYGTILDRAETKGDRVYKLRCAGPASWLRKSLGLHMLTDPLYPAPNLGLVQDEEYDETWIGVGFARVAWGALAHAAQGQLTLSYNYNWHTDNRLGTGDSLPDIVSQISDVIRCAATDTTTGGVLNTTNGDPDDGDLAYEEENGGLPTGGYSVYFGENGQLVKIRCQRAEDEGADSPGTDTFQGVMKLVLHAKVWAALGWDVNRPAIIGGDGIIIQAFSKITEWTPDGTTKFQTPGDGYWQGLFTTADESDCIQVVERADNHGNWKSHKAEGGQIGGGGKVWLNRAAKQRVSLGWDDLYLESQKARPPDANSDSVTINGTAVNSMGWFVVRAPVRVAFEQQGGDGLQDVTVPNVEVARCLWVTESDGTVRKNAAGQTEIYIEAWEDPRMFGFEGRRFRVHSPGNPEHGKQFDPWVGNANAFEFRHCMVIPGYVDGYPDHNWRALTRILTGSGTATTWTDVNTPPTVGRNAPASGDFWGQDLEIQDLGLNIEPDRVDYTSFKTAAGNFPGIASRLNNYRVCIMQPTQSQDILKAICQHRAWSFTWKKGSTGPQFGLFSPFEWVAPDDVEVTLTESDLHGEAGRPLSWIIDQAMRWEAPIDTIGVDASVNPSDGESSFTFSAESRDSKRRGRAGNRKHSYTARGAVDPTVWTEDNAWQGGKWLHDWRELWVNQVGQWFAERHFTIRGTWAAGSVGNSLYPGAKVEITDQRVIAPDGTEGITTHAGYVLECSHYKGGQVDAEILLQARDVTAFRYWAPLGEVTGYDTTAKTLTLTQNMSSHTLGAPHVDTYGFTETGWNSAIGGSAYLRVLQSWDGETFDAADDVSFTGASVSGNVITYTSLDSGTLYPDTYKYLILDDGDTHASTDWPRSRYAIVTNAAGKWGGSSTQGYEIY